jgi:uncharacterized protein (UPF0147 family)
MSKEEKKIVKQEQTEGQPVAEFKQKSIMIKPLPQILDEIEESIGSADAAAKDARQAAEEARKAGEKAANEAARVAAQAIAKVEDVARRALELAELLNAALNEAALGINKKLAGK